MKAMILAAGYGRRLHPLTEHTPKPLLAVRGKPLIEHHIEHLYAAGIRDIVINSSWLAEKLENALGDGSRFGVRITWSREQTPLETGGGIKRALPLLAACGGHTENRRTEGRSFLIVSGDTWMDYPLARLCAHKLNNALAHLVMAPNPDHNPMGDFLLDAHGRLGLKGDGGGALTYTGLAVIDKSLFDDSDGFGEVFPLREVLRPAIAAGRVTGELYRGVWSDVGTMERLEALNR